MKALELFRKIKTQTIMYSDSDIDESVAELIGINHNKEKAIEKLELMRGYCDDIIHPSCNYEIYSDMVDFIDTIILELQKMKALEVLTNSNIFDDRYVSENKLQKDIDEAVYELNNSSCDTCKYGYINRKRCVHDDMFFFDEYSIYMDIDFCCNRYEIKGDK